MRIWPFRRKAPKVDRTLSEILMISFDGGDTWYLHERSGPQAKEAIDAALAKRDGQDAYLLNATLKAIVRTNSA